MKCPKCGDADLVEHPLKNRDTRVDLCPRCRGVWFDEDELTDVIGTLKKNVTVPGNAKQRDFACPRCGSPLFTFPYPGTMVLIDMCRDCAGIWLDHKEIGQMKVAKAQAARAAAPPSLAPGETVPDTPAPAAATPSMLCPKCGAVGPKADECSACGVIVERFRTAAARNRDRERRLAEEYPGGRGLKGSMLRFVNGAIERLTTY